MKLYLGDICIDETTGDPYGVNMTTTESTSLRSPAEARPVNHAFFMLVRTTRAWIQLTPKQRFAFVDATIKPILVNNPDVTMRFFDSEAFCGRFSDVIMWETANILSYQAVVEELRVTDFWDTYFEVSEIVASIENAYAHHYKVTPY